MQTPLFLGIDGGGSRCRARVCNADGTLQGNGIAGPANTLLGVEQTFAAVTEACEKALLQAELEPGAISQLHAGLGLAGLHLQRERERVNAFPHPFASLIADTDAHIACLGAHGGRDGAILILGTGSSGCAIVDGKTHSVGGWGFDLADQGSGAALGRAAVRAALWAFEGVQPETPLSHAIMHQFNDSPEQAVLWAASAKPRDYANLAPLAFDHAAQGDALALKLINETAAGAASLVRALIDCGAPRVTLFGGLSAPLTPYFNDDIQKLLVAAEGDALQGAVLMARQHHQDNIEAQ